MASRMNPYLNFDGNAREAMEFYQQVFGGDLNINTFGEFEGPDSPNANGVMHAMLESDTGFALMASDMPPGMDFRPGTNFSISLSGEDSEELRGYWDKLSDGANIDMPLEKQMWGDFFGSLTDRFGVQWMVNIAGEQQG